MTLLTLPTVIVAAAQCCVQGLLIKLWQKLVRVEQNMIELNFRTFYRLFFGPIQRMWNVS